MYVNLYAGISGAWGYAVVFAGYSGFLHYLQLGSHELATIGINVTKKIYGAHLITALNNTQPHTRTMFPGYGCMDDDLTIKRSFNTQAMWVISHEIV